MSLVRLRASALDPPAFATFREGAPVVAALGLAAVPLWRWHPLAGLVAMAAAGCCAAFFRDPVRQSVSERDVVYAPADGSIIGLDWVERPWYLERPAHRVSVFLSLFDVHVNRSPAAGRIVAVRDLGGGFAPAMSFQRSHGNRRREIALETERGPLLLVQVAGVLARRIVGWVGQGEEVVAGQKLGMITFGSRTDLLIPVGSGAPVVMPGERVLGGQTPVARWL